MKFPVSELEIVGAIIGQAEDIAIHWIKTGKEK
jgi:hypothetical protein